MKRFIEGEDRSQSTLFPDHLDVRWSYFVGQFGSGVKVYSVV